MTDNRSSFFLSLVPRNVVVEAMPLEAFHAEAAANAVEADRARVASAAPERRREFLAGRHCARVALSRLGINEAGVTSGPDRRPVWPAGIVGSIAHTRNWCVAIAALDRDYRGLGVDLEPAEPVQERTWRKIITASERRWIESRPPEDRGRLVRLLFSAKESTWKCRFPADGVHFGFRDVDIRLDLDGGRYSAALFGNGLPGLVGRFQTDPDLIVTMAAWPVVC